MYTPERFGKELTLELDRVFVILQIAPLRCLLLALARRLDEGFSERQAEEYCVEISNAGPDDDLLAEFHVRLKGESLPLLVDVFPGNSDAFEVVFIVPKAVADLVLDEVGNLAGNVPARVLRAEGDG